MGQTGADVCRVQEGVEGFPAGQGEVGGTRDGGVCRAALSAPAQLFAAGEVAQVVDGHQDIGQGELSVLDGGGQQFPGPGRSGEDGVGAAMAVAGLGDAAQVLKPLLGEVAAQQQLDDRAVGSAGVGSGGLRGGGGEGPGVDQAAGTDGELAADRLETGPAWQVGVRWGQSTACGMRHQVLLSPCG